MTSGCQTGVCPPLNPLTFFVTYVFPFGDLDVFLIQARGLARDLQRVPILAGNRLNAAGCQRQNSDIRRLQKHFQLNVNSMSALLKKTFKEEKKKCLKEYGCFCRVLLFLQPPDKKRTKETPSPNVFNFTQNIAMATKYFKKKKESGYDGVGAGWTWPAERERV